MSQNNSLTTRKKILRYTLPLIVFIIAIFIAIGIMKSKPSSVKRANPLTGTLAIEAMQVTPTSYTIKINANGVISPRSQASIASQVSGNVVSVSSSFINGGFFSAGDTLLAIDDRDYKIAVRIAQATLVESQLKLSEEQAKSKQALADWQRLKRQGTPNDLVLRKPQLASAKATLSSAQAQLEQAKLNLSRTKIIAPYDGRVLNKQVDQGQFVSIGSALADIYAIDYVEVRLPLNSQQQRFINLPEFFKNTDTMMYPDVEITATFGNDLYQWPSKLIRTEGALDAKSRQLYTVAQIKDPYSQTHSDKPSLKIGQFVSAQISGISLDNVFVIPSNYVYEGNQVIIYEDEKVYRRDVQIIWRNETSAIIQAGLNGGESIVTTPLNSVISGTNAKLVNSVEEAN